MEFLFGSDMDHSVDVTSSEKSIEYSPLKHVMWKMINSVMGSFFSFAAVVQINDPDSQIWIVLYIIPALICFSLVTRPVIQGHLAFKYFCLCYIMICSFGILYSLYQGSENIAKQKGNLFAAEEAREAGGLAIVVSWLIMLLLTDSKKIQTMPLASWMKVATVALIPFLSASIWLYTADLTQQPQHCQGILKGL